MDPGIKATTNWTLVGGSDIAKSIQTKVVHEDVFIRPVLDEILSEERAVLLSRPKNAVPALCELQICVIPRYKIESLSLVCSAAKAEIFLGDEKEYTETLYGSLIDEDDEEEMDTQDALRSYRYDWEINKSGVVEIMLKLLTTHNELCIFGIVLNVAPNPNGITTLLPNVINFDNVQQMLNNSNAKLSPSAEKCKLFMQLNKTAQQPMDTAASPSGDSHSATLSMMQHFKQMMSTQAATATAERTEHTEPKQADHNLSEALKQYIDERLTAFEQRMQAQLLAHEDRQCAKLDQILKILQRE